MKKLKPAYTLLELIIVMSIIAIATGMGLAGLFLFRQVIQLDNAVVELKTNLTTYRNMARNSVPSTAKTAGNNPTDKIVDGYAVFFADNNYDLLYCDKLSATSLQYVCNVNEIEKENQKSALYNEVAIAPQTASCVGILFERLTGRMVGLADTTGIPIRTGSCVFRLTHSSNLASKYIHVNLSQNEIEITNSP